MSQCVNYTIGTNNCKEHCEVAVALSAMLANRKIVWIIHVMM